MSLVETRNNDRRRIRLNSLEKETYVGRMYRIVWEPQNVSIFSLDKACVRINVEREFSNTHCDFRGRMCKHADSYKISLK